MSFKRFVDAVQLFVVLSAALTVVLLFTNEPAKVAAPTADADGAVTVDGGALYSSRCAGCHGSSGGGGVGPALDGGRTVTAYPDIDDMIVVVAEGRGGMPGFGRNLSAEEIAAVVEYVRTDL